MIEPSICACGRPVPKSREVYVTPTCYTCLSPPMPLRIIYISEHARTYRDAMVGKDYRHYKGGRYRVENIAFDSEDRTQLYVVYTSLDTGRVWKRPLTSPNQDAWEDLTIWPDGVERKRFTQGTIEFQLGDIDFSRPAVTQCDECLQFSETTQPRKVFGKKCKECWEGHQRGYLTEADITRSDRESVVKTLREISALVPHDSAAYQLAQEELAWLLFNPVKGSPLSTTDAYGLPNDLREAKEEIHAWREALESTGWLGTPNTLRKRANEFRALDDLSTWIATELDANCCTPFSGQEERRTALSEVQLKIRQLVQERMSAKKEEPKLWPEWDPKKATKR